MEFGDDLERGHYRGNYYNYPRANYREEYHRRDYSRGNYPRGNYSRGNYSRGNYQEDYNRRDNYRRSVETRSERNFPIERRKSENSSSSDISSPDRRKTPPPRRHPYEKKYDNPRNYYNEMSSRMSRGGGGSRGRRPPFISDPVSEVKLTNNYWKRQLITHHTRETRDGPVVLDLCCGRGGDLDKWFYSSPNMYFGLDVAEESISFAKERYRKSRKFFHRDPIFTTIDLNTDNIPIAQDASVDLVSCQFAFHYLTTSSTQLNHIMKEIARVLKKGGFFFGIAPNPHHIQSVCENGGMFLKDREGQTYFEILPDTSTSYYFTLKGCLDNVRETVINWEEFVKVASENGLEWNYRGAFDISILPTISREAREILHLNKSFSFVKI